MPVTGLYFCPDSGTTQAPAVAIVDRLSKRYQPVFTTKWTLEHRLLRENGPAQSQTPNTPNTPTTAAAQQARIDTQPRFMQYLDLSQHPGKRFCLVDKTIVTLDPDFEQILTAKLQGLWSMRQTLKAEGSAFDLEDFRIRIATLSQGSMIKGVLVEVEYLPCTDLAQGEAVIRDFIDRLELPSGANVRLYFSQAARGEADADREFSILDTGMQYMDLLRLR
ncbi:hypothetical protein H072_7916 [Dactylellina haptotyla CBS 200.50]|uniref:Mediator of RNA polymerase II transcription subunit 20 n=1 Tax=Dactylellina haptotyla (strain CBS 200.50) TaxID=1284197 RepID=S8BFZ0_DACHA|nr:hypothetical protein H072_7916 [Dactylellina haptotyla CBS 200.50]